MKTIINPDGLIINPEHVISYPIENNVLIAKTIHKHKIFLWEGTDSECRGKRELILDLLSNPYNNILDFRKVKEEEDDTIAVEAILKNIPSNVNPEHVSGLTIHEGRVRTIQSLAKEMRGIS